MPFCAPQEQVSKSTQAIAGIWKGSSVLSFNEEHLKLQEFLNISFANLLKKELGCPFESDFQKVYVDRCVLHNLKNIVIVITWLTQLLVKKTP